MKKVLAVTNCSNKKRTVHFKHPNLIAVNSLLNNSVQYDIIDDVLNITLAPYQVAWFKI